MYKRKRAGNTITRKINSTKDTAAKADKNHYISNSYLEGFIPIDTEYFTASGRNMPAAWRCMPAAPGIFPMMAIRLQKWGTKITRKLHTRFHSVSDYVIGAV